MYTSVHPPRSEIVIVREITKHLRFEVYHARDNARVIHRELTPAGRLAFVPPSRALYGYA